jgi:hypothetical protein
MAKGKKRMDQLKEQLTSIRKQIAEYEKRNFSKLSEQEIRSYNLLRVDAEMVERKISNLQSNEPELGSEKISHYRIVSEQADRKINRS